MKDESEKDGSREEFVQEWDVYDCEESLTPDLWLNMSCDDELHEDGDCLDTFHSDNAHELSNCQGEPLLCDLNFNEEIPDMDCFRKPPAGPSQEETLGDEQALYQDSPLSVGESSLLLKWHFLYVTSFLGLHLRTCWN